METSVVDIHKKNGKRPEFDIYIGRAVRNTEFKKASIWRNPYSIKKFGLEKCLWFYERHIRLQIKVNPEYNIEELRGKRLGCWCITTDKLEPLACHGQILMKILGEKDD